jgi:hypothetical protein
MDYKKGKFKAYADKTKSALVDFGEGEQWTKVTGNAQQYVQKLEKNSEVSFGMDNGEIVYCKTFGSSFKQAHADRSSNSDNKNAIKEMSELKNKTNARICAIECATRLAASGTEENEKKPEAIIEMAGLFLNFIEDNEDVPQDKGE